MYSKGMLAVCRRYIKDNNNAEELMLNGFFKFFTTIERFNYSDEKSIGSWLKTIILNECFMFLRRNKDEQLLSEDFAVEVSMDEGILDKMEAAEILRLIAAMPDGYRVVFSMYIIEGYSHKEISTILGITEGASKSQLSRAKIFLQKKLAANEMMYER
ncbi:MAG: sigma-70 family RNA polymerase sigma factor [Taibaiella sp.]|nr:sigma-70 family RNA polymerase sigma factor [Taibaiella sp.]